jgi:acyl-CoA thioesterase I
MVCLRLPSQVRILKKVVGISLILIAGIIILAVTTVRSDSASATTPIRYAAIGDSYSIGEGASPAQAWPALLAEHLTQAGIPVKLVANPSRTGWTTQQAIDNELPVWQAARPQLASVQIGVNDWVQGVDAKTFQHRLHLLLDAVQQVVPDTNRVFLVTLPDFSVTPTGVLYVGGRDAVKGLTEFNDIVKQEAAVRGLQVVDLFVLSQGMKNNPELTAPDGLHPSAKEYALWEGMIFPVVKTLLSITDGHR